MKKAIYSIFILSMSILLFSSCEKDEIQTIEDANALSTKQEKASCQENLVSNGCRFTSGKGTGISDQYIIMDMLNNCYTEALSSNCTWWRGNITRTNIIDIDFDAVCHSSSYMNSRLNFYKSTAVNSKPDNSYLVINYERLSGGPLSANGPYRMKVRVTYRKKICSNSGTGDNGTGAGGRR